MNDSKFNTQQDSDYTSSYIKSIQMRNEYDTELMKLKHEERKDAFKIAITIIAMGIILGTIYLIG